VQFKKYGRTNNQPTTLLASRLLIP